MNKMKMVVLYLITLHLAAINQYEAHFDKNIYLYRHPNIQYILEAAAKHNLKINLDVFSRSGSTALYYLINHERFDEARLLIEVGANPTAHRADASERNPLS